MRGEVLVAIAKNKRDLTIARDEHWYRVPVSSAHKWLKNRWPPQWLALYLPKAFGDEAFSVSYYARVLEVRKVLRWQLFPEEPRNEKSTWQYYQLLLGSLQKLPKPILSRRWRRITFIPTTWPKFIEAVEINDLYDESPLEDRLWAEFKRHDILAERQEFIRIDGQNYALDFAIYCAGGQIDVETDGDTWHANPERAATDNLRDNALGTNGWKVLRFTSRQVNEQMEEYCIHTVAGTINYLGGIDEGGLLPRKINIGPESQLGLFDNPPTG